MILLQITISVNKLIGKLITKPIIKLWSRKPVDIHNSQIGLKLITD